MTVLVQLDNVHKVFLADEIETRALSKINLSIHAGEYVAIAGPSGCGKSTLLSIMGLLDVPSEGRYWLNGVMIDDISKREMAWLRNKEIGFIFQSFNLISDLTIEENVALPLIYRGDISRSQQKERVQQALEMVNMSHRVRHYPSQLSGGQQQRVAVARAIVGCPSLLLADEPTGNLDSANAEAVMDILDTLHNDGTTICIVTHDSHSARRARRMVVLFDGQVVADGENGQLRPAV
ncbi:ABC transporter ATP-binding protein [Pectobacteriaceae bacterium CE70]|uniref:ABC transporter ATP-binding protein n=1 Tax=Serratia sp. (strain ATCC 39006) TaxID=104623 RepID=A0A2I5TEA1_SERS3|nr:MULTISPECIES: ABC transporter ATP-binding protein [Enterobacterales]WJV62749.1 ABC transporter ATP-binding protein [Pectobacteriaceae bacterium C52]WJV67082.1 ABC transporter ATP-binding protein [Pectobacteriaceae bacterium CE70]WJY11066.1 ABC transporter ATP-binding protein [Pectobacteriaceae bacterium C80]AUG98578.1 ABC transporter ATP-binding protein [Serratia sp. ATCC 39006]AUH02893.1 ABC transporter ATP-binding protein [Serratia sp. ATCC 39006]